MSAPAAGSDDPHGAGGRLTLLPRTYRGRGSIRRNRSRAPADRAGAAVAACGDRFPGHRVSSARPPCPRTRAPPSGGRRAALRPGGPRPRRLAHGRDRRHRAATLATVRRANPRLQGDGGRVSAAPLGRAWPWIGFFHGATSENLSGRFYHWLGRRLLGSAERVVVMSHAQARAFRHCDGHVRIIYNAALDLPPVRDVSERNRLGALASTLRRPIVGGVGRLSPEKGVDLFVDACAMLARKGLRFSALIAGDGPQRAQLAARCGRLGLKSCVRFIGHVYDVEAVYRNLDLLVLPSRSEGLPNAVLEAIRADVPVVATAVGAVPEVVGTSPAARLVTPGSAAALAEAMEGAVTHGDSPDAAAARREVVGRLSLERRVEAHLELYREILDERAGVMPACAASPAA